MYEMPLIYVCGGWGLSHNGEFKEKLKYAEQDTDCLNVEVSQLQLDLATKPAKSDSHHNTTYASLLRIQLMLLLRINTDPPSSIRAYP